MRFNQPDNYGERLFEKIRQNTLQAIDYACDHALLHGMDYGDVQNIRWAIYSRKTIAWGADYYASAPCPLRAAGYERSSRYRGPWLVKGGLEFERAWDHAMGRLIGGGPGMRGVPKASA